MKKITKFLLVPLMAGGLLTGCSLTDSAGNIDQEKLNATLDSVNNYLEENTNAVYTTEFAEDSLKNHIINGIYKNKHMKINYTVTEKNHGSDEYGNFWWDGYTEYKYTVKNKLYYDAENNTLKIHHFKETNLIGGHNISLYYMHKLESNVTSTRYDANDKKYYSESDSRIDGFTINSYYEELYNILTSEDDYQIAIESSDGNSITYNIIVKLESENFLVRCTFKDGLITEYKTTHDYSYGCFMGTETTIEYNTGDVVIEDIDSYTAA